MKSLPLVTYNVLSYNQEKYIEESVNSALAQDYPNMEIILSDDCSTDNTFKIMQNIVSKYKGPHKVILNRNQSNLGIREHLKLIDSMSHGEILMGNAGDDVALPNFTSVAVDIMMKHPEVMSLSFEMVLIDENSKILPKGQEFHTNRNDYAIFTLTEYINFRDFFLFQGASRVRRRSLLDAFPPLSTAPDEDVYNFIRSLYVGSIAYVHQSLLLYRKHTNNITAVRTKNSFNESYRLKMKELSESQLHEDLDYALKKGYIDANIQKYMLEKINRIYDNYIQPVPMNKWKRRAYKYSGKLIEMIFK